VSGRLAPSFLPRVAALEVTRACNHACVFCSCPWEDPGSGIRRDPELSTDAWRALLDRLAAMGVSSFAFTGGEPLLRPDLSALLEHAAGLRPAAHEGPPTVLVITNGRAFEPAHAALLARLGVRLAVSLPGLSTYARHTGADGPERALAALAAGRDAGLTTTVNVTVTRWNLHEVFEAVAVGLLAGAGSVLVNRFLPGGRGLRYAADLALDAPATRDALAQVDAALEAAARNGHLGTEVPRCAVDPAAYRRLRVGTRCAAGTGFFVVGPGGWIRACNHSPEDLVPWEALDELPAHPTWRRMIRADWLPAACRGCRHAGACDGGCREAARVCGGALDGPDPCLPPAPLPWA